MVGHTCITCTWEAKPKDWKFKARLHYIVSSCLLKKERKEKKKRSPGELGWRLKSRSRKS
jgi:hypothetical protein